MTIRSDCPSFNYTKLYLPACKSFNGLDVEIIGNESGETFYLNALTFEFQDSVKSGYVDVHVEIDGEHYSGEGIKLEGGQKVVLAQEMQELIVEALVEGKQVNVSIGRYQETLIPNNFPSKFVL